jgi:hypothetical protein
MSKTLFADDEPALLDDRSSRSIKDAPFDALLRSPDIERDPANQRGAVPLPSRCDPLYLD